MQGLLAKTMQKTSSNLIKMAESTFRLMWNCWRERPLKFSLKIHRFNNNKESRIYLDGMVSSKS